MTKNPPLACDLTVFSPSKREEIATTIPEIFLAVQAVEELPDGYAFQFSNQPDQFMKLAYFVEHERQCCSFYHFTLEVEPNGGPLWLQITGSQEVKQFIKTIWGDLQGAVQQELVQTGGNDLDAVITQTTPILVNTLQKAKPLTKDNK